MRNLKKLITIIALVSMLVTQNAAMVYAESEIPTPPPAPTAPAAPTAPPAPTAPASTPNQPTPPATPVATNTPVSSHTPNPKTPKPSTAPTATPTNAGNTSSTSTPTPSSSPASSPAATPVPTVTPTPVSGGDGGQNQSGSANGSSITTGDATTAGSIVTSANTNESVSPQDNGGSIQVGNTGNGTDSNNNGSVSVQNNDSTTQNNSANVANSLSVSTVTGDNDANKNTGGNNVITTGNANTSGTIITGVNTNLDGVHVSEFNVADDHIGDLVLDFNANCVSGCRTGNGSATNTGNGANSTNNAATNVTNTNATFQNNDATVGNNMTLVANSGDNNANKNTGGDNSINTGDANVSANVVTFANNNLAGNVYYGVVNIYGDLQGDILLPQSVIDSLVGNTNTGNGAGSTNNASSSASTTNTTTQSNAAVIENNVNVNAQTGGNNTDKNTNGDNSVTTGDSNVVANVVNVVNSNLSGGNWWLVIVNEAGQWIGRIVGAPTASGDGTVAGSEGTQLNVGPNGEITASNNGNGADSTNNASTNSSTTNTTTQTNTAHVTNNLDLKANTGNNDASKNTGGNSSVNTGDAQIIANLVNFVNNNITGGGKLLVTVVNVFGSWLGDFVAPGAQKETANNNVPSNSNEPARGGSAEQSPTTQSISSTSTTQTAPVETPYPTVRPIAYASSLAGKNLNGEIAVAVESADSTPGKSDVLADATFADESPVSKALNINLAWLLPVVAIVFAFIFIKKIRARFL